MMALGERIHDVHESDQRLLRAKRELEMQMKDEDKKGLASAVLGQLFDVPEEERSMGAHLSDTTKATSASGKGYAHTEGAVKKHPFQTFFTTGEPVNFETVNKFEGRSNYQHYYPTGETTEQKLE